MRLCLAAPRSDRSRKPHSSCRTCRASSSGLTRPSGRYQRYKLFIALLTTSARHTQIDVSRDEPARTLTVAAELEGSHRCAPADHTRSRARISGGSALSSMSIIA